MLKLLGWMIKMTFFTGLVLVLGNWVHWGNKTVSDQVKSGMSQAERLPGMSTVKTWADQLSSEAKKKIGLHGRAGKPGSRTMADSRTNSSLSFSASSTEADEIPPSERQKLKALIRELNSSPKHQ